MSNLVIEIGNTALKAALSEGIILGKTFRYQGEKKTDFIISLIKREIPDVVLVASVSEITVSDEKRIKSYCQNTIIIDSNRKELLSKYNLPDYLSPDRAASIIGARHLFKNKSCTLIDLGTTLTVDFIDAEGHYEGGNISLGCMTRFKALHRYSKSLPSVNPPSEVQEIGSTAISSIESGVISGIMFELQAYADLKPDNIVLFTGGDAIFFVKKMKNSIFVICNLVLIGLALITDEYDKEKNQ